MAVQRDSFAKVKEMMDTMVAEMKKQQAEEVKFKSYCKKELDETEKTSHDKAELKKDLETTMGLLNTRVKDLAEEIKKDQDQISATESEIKSAGQTREEENIQFQATVSDQRATQTILKKAVMKLKDFYHKGIGKAVLTQKAVQTPPTQFNDYKTNEGASPVIGLIEQILEESVALEETAIAAEKKAQEDYQEFVKKGNALIKDLQGSVTTKTEGIAAAREELSQVGEDHQSAESELESLQQVSVDLHAECDWTLKNFDMRQKARSQEIEAIFSAKAILSGAK